MKVQDRARDITSLPLICGRFRSPLTVSIARCCHLGPSNTEDRMTGKRCTEALEIRLDLLRNMGWKGEQTLGLSHTMWPRKEEPRHCRSRESPEYT